MPELLGNAVLELQADLRPLALGLTAAERETSMALGRMQAESDRRLGGLGKSMGASFGGVGRSLSASMSGVERDLGASFARTEARSQSLGRNLERSMTVSLAGASRAARSAGNEVERSMTASFAGASRSARNLGRDVERSIRPSTAAIGSATTATRNYGGSLASAANAEAMFGRRAEDGRRTRQGLTSDTRNSESAMKDLGRAVGGPFGSVMVTATGHAQNFRKHGIDYLAGGVLGLETAFVGLSVKAAVKFEELTKTVAQQTGLSGRSLDGLMGTIRKVARDSPYAINEVAQAAITMRTQFHANDQQIEHSANLLVAYAHATGQDVQPALQQLSRIMHDFRVPAGDAVKVTDELIGVAQATQQPLAGFANSIDKFGPRFQALGLNMQDSIRLMGIFAASGIKGDQMGRGLTSALGSLMKAAGMGGAAKSMQDMGLKTKEANLSIETAQKRVSTLEEKINNLKPSSKNYREEQSKLNDELNLAQQRLDIARQKSDDLTKSTKAATKPHGDLSKVMDEEIHRIGSAKTYTDALNIAVDAFGKNMGPSMARAFWHNQQAIQEADKAMRRHNETQKLFNEDAHSIPGELQKAKNEFQNLEITIGTKFVPVMGQAINKISSAISSFDDFYKRHKNLVQIAAAVVGIGSAITLLSRHTPLGSILGRLFQMGTPGAARRGIAGFLSGPGGGGISGIHGPIGAGGPGNPISVIPEGGLGGGVGGGAAGEAGGTMSVLRAALTSPEGLLIIGGTAATVAAAVFGGRALLGRYATPYNTPYAQSINRTTSLSPQSYQGYGGQTIHPVEVHPGAYGPTQAGAGGGFMGAGDAPFIRESASVERANKDFVVMNNELVKLAKNQQGVKQTATALDRLAADAKKAGDVKWAMADRLGAELLRSRNVSSRGVRNIVGELNKLEPGARYAASQSMIRMARELEQSGRIPRNSSAKLVTEMVQGYQSMKDRGGRYWHGLMTDAKNEMQYLEAAARNSSGKTRDEYLAAIGQLKDGVAGKLSAMLHSDVIPNMDQMRAKIESGSKEAGKQGAQNIAAFASNVRGALEIGAISANTATQLINQALGAELRAYGVTKLPTVTDLKGNIKSQFGATVGFGTGAALGFAAKGALIPIGQQGSGGTDTVPVNLMVGEGETVAVFNRYQRPIAEQLMAPVGGLEGLFNRVDRPNYMASGGIAFSGPASTFGPPGEAAGQTASGHSSAEPGLSLRIPGTSWNDPRNRALMGQMFNIAVAGHQGNFPDIDLGPFDWTGRNVDVTGAAAQQMGLWPFPTGSIASINGGAGGGAGAAGGGVAWTALQPPTIAGTGPIADDVRAVARLGTAAANQYGQAHMPKLTVGGATGLPPGGTPAQVIQAMTAAASSIIGLPYTYGGGHGSFAGTPGFDCSGAVSYVLHAGGLIASPEDTVALGSYGDPGPGKYVTVAVLPNAGMSGHTMMSFGGKYFESGGSGGGPHWDSGWSQSFPVFRHPPGYAVGGIADVKGDGGMQNPLSLLAHQPELVHNKKFRRWAQEHGMSSLLEKAGPAALHMGPGGVIHAAQGAASRARGAKNTGGGGKHPKSHPHHGSRYRPPTRASNVRITVPKGHTFPLLDQALWYLADATGGSIPTSSATASLGLPQDWGSWLSHLENDIVDPIDHMKFGDAATPIITLADQSQLINWFDPAKGDQYPWTGYVDPSSGQRVKSVHRRMHELGNPAHTGMASAADGLAGTWSIDHVDKPGWTELGVIAKIIDDYTKAYNDIVAAGNQLKGFETQLTHDVNQETIGVNWILRALGFAPTVKPYDVSNALGGVDGDVVKGLVDTATLTPAKLADLKGRYAPKDWSGFSALVSTKTKKGKRGEVPIKGGFRKYVMELVTELTGAQANAAYAAWLEDAATGAAGGEGTIAAWQGQAEGWYKNPSHSWAARPGSKGKAGTPAGWDKQGRLNALDQEKASAEKLIKKPSWWTGPDSGDASRKIGWGWAASKHKSDIEQGFAMRRSAVSGAGSLSAAQSAEDYAITTTWKNAEEKNRDARQKQWSGIANPYVYGGTKLSGSTTKYAPGSSSLGRDTVWFSQLGFDLASLLAGDSTYLAELEGKSGGTSLATQIATYAQPGGQFSRDRDNWNTTFGERVQEYGDISGTTIAAHTGISPVNQATLNTLLQTQLQQQGELIDVMAAQYRVLGNLPPFGGSFAEGGVVPGPAGMPRTIIAHAGETITPESAGDVPAVVIEKAGELDRLVDVRIEKRSRDWARTAARRLPSRGGGQLVG